MKRNWQCLEGASIDVLVIGGGIYGAWTAADAALRGYRVAVIERSDWASATSSASSKLIHGGFRYLGQYRFGLARKSLKERELLSRIMPHRVRPLSFLVPHYRGDPVGPFAINLGLRLYDGIAGKSFFDNRDRSMNRDEILSSFPFLSPSGLLSGACYTDALTDDARLVLEVVQAAENAGAVTANYAEALTIQTRRTHLVVSVRDHLSGETTEVAARTVVDTTGAWAMRLVDPDWANRHIRLTKGIHLTVPALPTEHAFLLMQKADNRVVFLIPWYGRTLIGTTDTDIHSDMSQAVVENEDVVYLLESANRVLASPLEKEHVQATFCGLRALWNEPGKPPSAVSREWVLETPRPNLFSSIGGKLTSARADAAVLVDRVSAFLGNNTTRNSPTETKTLPFCPEVPFESWLIEKRAEAKQADIDPETIDTVLLRYGTAVDRILQLARGSAELARRIIPDLPFIRAEIVYATMAEMVVHLDDLLRRRIPLLALTRPERAVIRDAGSLVAPLLGWNAARRSEEEERIFQQWNL